MKLHELSPAKGSRRPRKRVGRGQGAGQGKTSGRGQKGQGSRSSVGLPTGFGEHVRIDHGVLLEADELAEVDHHVFVTPAIVEPAQFWQALLEGHLATFEAGREPDARSRSLTLLAATAGLALPGTLAATDPLARPAAALGGTQFMQLHAAFSESAASS